MTSRIGGTRRKSRHKMKKSFRDKGKISTSKYMKKFNAGTKVYLTMEPAIQKGSYPTRFKGKVGIIREQSGICYKVSIKEGVKEKLLIIHPAHLKEVQ